MEQLNDIVQHYLAMRTNNALMITGAWGSGKTYYYEHVIKPSIKETKVFGDHSKAYIPLHISLFGLGSIEEIQTKILLSIHPLLDNGVVELAANVTKSLVKGVMALKGYLDFTGIIDDVANEVTKSVSVRGTKSKKFIKFSELVLCFDDLERCSESLNIEEFIGFINLLVENQETKVLIIANEDKISPSKYQEFKEKVVGNSIEFLPNIGVTYDQIVSDRFLGSPLYKTFLEERKDFILKNFALGSTNFRTLIFTLSYFQTIFSEIESHLFNEKKLIHKRDEILDDVLKFTLAISIEYKEGKLTFSARQELDLPKNSVDLMSLMGTPQVINQSEIEENTRNGFISKYQYRVLNFYKSIYDYITGGSIFHFDELLNELKEFYHIEERFIPPHYEIYNELSHNNFQKLENSVYINKTKELIVYASKGKYGLHEYLMVFSYAIRIGNPLRLNLKSLEKKLIRGMKLTSGNFIPSLSMRLMPSSNVANRDYLIRLHDAAVVINDKIKDRESKLKLVHFQKNCYDNFKDFSSEVLTHENQYSPIFHTFSERKFYSFFLKSSNNEKAEILDFFRERYERNEALIEVIDKEIEFMRALHKRIAVKNNSLKGKNVNGSIVSEFLKLLEAILNRFHEYYPNL